MTQKRITDVDGNQQFEPWPDTQVHVEWGTSGAALAAARGDLVILVDVLSFSTSMSIACNRGATLFVYSQPELEAQGGRKEVARRLNAKVIGKSRHAEPGGYSLSPSSLVNCEPNLRLIMTSLNGAHCVAESGGKYPCLIGCFRNRNATADYASALLSADADSPRRVTLIACGEQWSSVSDHSAPRPGLEDWLGAGAIVAALVEHGLTASVEALAAKATFLASSNQLVDVLTDCVSGRELITRGFGVDIALAAQLDVDQSSVVEHVPGGRKFSCGILHRK